MEGKDRPRIYGIEELRRTFLMLCESPGTWSIQAQTNDVNIVLSMLLIWGQWTVVVK